MNIPFPKCKDSRACFARNRFKDCTILKETPRPGKCSFCKPEQDVTHGCRYGNRTLNQPGNVEKVL